MSALNGVPVQLNCVLEKGEMCIITRSTLAICVQIQNVIIPPTCLLNLLLQQECTDTCSRRTDITIIKIIKCYN